MKKLTAIIATASVLAINLPAFAKPTYNGASIYKDAQNNIYIATNSASEPVQVAVSGAEKNELKSTDACGIFSLNVGTAPTASVKINGSSVSLANAPTVTKSWSCLNGSLKNDYDEAPSATQPVVKVGTTYYFKQAANTNYAVQYSGNFTSSKTSNACKFVALTSTTKSPIFSTTTIGVNGATPVAVSSLPNVTSAPRCVSNVTYVPLGWTP